MLNAIILAGEEKSSKWNDVSNKALLKISGKLMIEYVIEALKSSECIDKIIVAGPREQLFDKLSNKVDGIVDTNSSIMDNLMAGVKHLGSRENLLVCTCDIPFITSEAINDFIQSAQDSGADLCYPIIEKRVNIRRFPDAQRTYVRIKEGTFTGGNLFYVNPLAIEKGYHLAVRFLKNRKRPLEMARIIGLSFLAQLLIGRLSLDRIERKFSTILDIKAKAIISSYAEIGNDIDKPSDVIVATNYLGNQK